MDQILADSRLSERQKHLFTARYQPLLRNLRRKARIVSVFYWMAIIYSGVISAAVGVYPVATKGIDVDSVIASIITAIGLSPLVVLTLFATFQLPKLHSELRGVVDSLDDVYWQILEADLPDWTSFTAVVADILKKYRQEIKEITSKIESTPRDEE